MSLENIQLPDFIIADIYKDYLVELESVKEETVEIKAEKQPEATIKEAVTPGRSIKFLGENKKNIAIVVSHPDTAFLPSEDLSFLTNILKACNLTVADVAIINIYGLEVTHQSIQEQLVAKVCLLFGVEPSSLKLPFFIPDFQVQNFAGCQYLKAPELSTINDPTPDGKLLKGNLWVNLQKLFPKS